MLKSAGTWSMLKTPDGPKPLETGSAGYQVQRAQNTDSMIKIRLQKRKEVQRKTPLCNAAKATNITHWVTLSYENATENAGHADIGK